VKSIRSFLFVVIQFVCISILLYTGSLFPSLFYLLFLSFFAIVLGLWAITVMWMSKLNIFPDVRDGAFLVRIGPYRILRHPMYLAVILFCATLVLDTFSVFRIIVLLVLIIDLIIKIEYEEKLLAESFPDYAVYRRKTWKLVPFLY